ncbi:signal peptidase I [Geoglobus acetivorans]|uniref:Signal peptidase I n=1 Tax=Geoglobus acetivorans TaxID=565033 RepID=A0A0A7GBM0_GEOAI|nr:Signal peptidase I [Geoglobus acetivorans]
MQSKLVGLIKDILTTLIIVGVIAGGGYLLTGTWPFMVAVQSGSMEPNLHIGDVVFLVSPEKKEIVTYLEGKENGYKKFGDYGDVIVYRPNGDSSRTPIIHRAITFVHKGEKIGSYVAENDGYLTKGDNNPVMDQPLLSKPVKKEWIVGVAVFKIPYIGYFRLLFS